MSYLPSMLRISSVGVSPSGISGGVGRRDVATSFGTVSGQIGHQHLAQITAFGDGVTGLVRTLSVISSSAVRG
jgi:hypothetical protein